MGIGISVYPLLSSKEDNLNYIKKAYDLGYSRIFTSMLEVDSEKEKALEQIECYREIMNYAKNLGMRVFIDINPQVLKNIGVDPTDLKFFLDLGVTGIRLDGIFNGIHEMMMTYNEYNLDIEINGSLNTSYANNIVDFGCKKEKLVVCHNFYPEEYTGLSLEFFNSCMDRHKALGLKTAAFVNGTKGGKMGPWPTNDGLPTLEKHRYKDIIAQADELFALGVDDVIIGNAFATNEELEALANLDKDIIKLKFKALKELTEVEKSFFNRILNDRHESSEQIIRYSMGRVEFKNKSIPSDNTGNKVVKRGTVLINNDEYLNYKGELIIAREELKIDNRRNVIGSIEEDYLDLLDYIKYGKKFIIEY